MSKKLTFTFEGTDYTLEFTRRTVMQMEDEGFSISDIDAKPLSTCSKLFAGAFLANHPRVKRGKVIEMFDAMPDKAGLLQRLAEMYNDPIAAFMDEPEEGVKNVEWTANW